MAAEFLMEYKRKRRPENVLLGDMIDRYIDNRTNILSPSSVASYRKIRRIALQELMDVRMGYITAEMYQSAINNYAKGRSPRTVEEAHRLIFRVLKEGYVDIQEEEILLPARVRTEVIIPTTEEVKQILEGAREKEIYLAVAFAALLGLRKSEIFALTWDDIDWEKQTVHINKSTVKDEYGIYVIKATKTYQNYVCQGCK
ncbi:tyrosine-type recombinase/integrase [Eubacteriales bacterium OttesenSCG-928-M02]|nr:tyrosine-type recombinase/integrase [Eubacteriales bacterium OttesenSCG-928-M02]